VLLGAFDLGLFRGQSLGEALAAPASLSTTLPPSAPAPGAWSGSGLLTVGGMPRAHHFTPAVMGGAPPFRSADAPAQPMVHLGAGSVQAQQQPDTLYSPPAVAPLGRPAIPIVSQLGVAPPQPTVPADQFLSESAAANVPPSDLLSGSRFVSSAFVRPALSEHQNRIPATDEPAIGRFRPFTQQGAPPGSGSDNAAAPSVTPPGAAGAAGRIRDPISGVVTALAAAMGQIPGLPGGAAARWLATLPGVALAGGFLGQPAAAAGYTTSNVGRVFGGPDSLPALSAARAFAPISAAIPTARGATRDLFAAVPEAAGGLGAFRDEAPLAPPPTAAAAGARIGHRPVPDGRMVDPLLGQVTLIAPPLNIASAQSEQGGAAVRMDWAMLARGAGTLDAGGLARLKAALPVGTQAIYPALPPGSGGPNGVNLALAPALLGDLLGQGYGPGAVGLAAEAAGRGAAATGGTSPAMPLPAKLVPTEKRPAGTAGGLLGTGIGADGATASKPAGALEEAGGGTARRGGVLDFLGMPVRLAPSLGGRSELAQETAARGGGLTTGAMTPQTLRPNDFAALRQRLFPAFQSVTTEPDRDAWRKAAPDFGLRDSEPTTLLAPDARAPRITETSPLPQTGDANAAGGRSIAAMSPVLAGALQNDTLAREAIGSTSASSSSSSSSSWSEAVPTRAGRAGLGTSSFSPLARTDAVAPSTPPGELFTPSGGGVPSLPSSSRTPIMSTVSGAERFLSRSRGGALDTPDLSPASAAATPSVFPTGSATLPSMAMSGRNSPSLPTHTDNGRVQPDDWRIDGRGTTGRTGMVGSATATSWPSVPAPLTVGALPMRGTSASPPGSVSALPLSLLDLPTQPSALPLAMTSGAPARFGTASAPSFVSTFAARRPSREQMPLAAGGAMKPAGSPLMIQRSTRGTGLASAAAAKEGTLPPASATPLASRERGTADAEVHLLANEVYSLLKRRLVAEAERRGRW